MVWLYHILRHRVYLWVPWGQLDTGWVQFILNHVMQYLSHTCHLFFSFFTSGEHIVDFSAYPFVIHFINKLCFNLKSIVARRIFVLFAFLLYLSFIYQPEVKNVQTNGTFDVTSSCIVYPHNVRKCKKVYCRKKSFA